MRAVLKCFQARQRHQPKNLRALATFGFQKDLKILIG